MFYSTNHRLNRKLRCWIKASIFWLSSCHIADAKSQYRRFISRQKTYNWNSNKNVEVQIQDIQSKTGRYYQIGGAIWKPGGTIWSWVQLAPPDYLGWLGTIYIIYWRVISGYYRTWKSEKKYCIWLENFIYSENRPFKMCEKVWFFSILSCQPPGD